MPSTASPIKTWSSVERARTAATAPRAAALSAKTRTVTPSTTGTSATRREATERSRLALEPDLAERGQELGRGGLRAALEAFDVGLDQPAARVEVERDPDRVVEDH